MPELRQKLLVLYLRTSALDSSGNDNVVAWSIYDGTGKTHASSGDSEEPPYPSVVAAMQDGWRVIQTPLQWPSYPGTEYLTSHLKFECILEKMEPVDA